MQNKRTSGMPPRGGYSCFNAAGTRANIFTIRVKKALTGGETEWVESPGLGEIYSCSVSYRAKVPYCIAYVRLDEGPIMLTNILSDDLDSIEIGQRVGVVFEPDDKGKPAPFFTPVTSCP
ncbi:MAG: OB-fold domain-containing protein [Exilibacterium sp.]